jgi:colanic acid biosynthesis glycosyl transferase WcaI
MKILILTNYFPPEIGGAAHLYFELAASLVKRGHQVTVVTGFPRYNVKTDAGQYHGKLFSQENIEGINLLRIYTIPFPHKSKILRGLDHFAVAAIYAMRGLFLDSYNVILVYSPPLPLGLAAFFLSKIKKVPFVVNIQDLFPKEAIDLGLLTNRIIIRIFEALECFIYKQANHITVHSPGNLDYIVSRGANPEKVSVCYNWVDTERVSPGNYNNQFAKTHNLDGRFVVSYAGTMGWCQDMQVIVAAAQLLKDYNDILFLMVGDGVEKEKAQRQGDLLKLSNIKWLPPQSWKVYPQILAASRVSMINLNANLKTPVVPSKLLNIMAAGRPVVASLPLHGDAPRIIQEAQAGLCVPPNDPKALAAAILRFYKDEGLCKEYGQNGRAYAEKYFSRAVGIEHYERVLKQVCEAQINKKQHQ